MSPPFLSPFPVYLLSYLIKAKSCAGQGLTLDSTGDGGETERERERERERDREIRDSTGLVAVVGNW